MGSAPWLLACNGPPSLGRGVDVEGAGDGSGPPPQTMYPGTVRTAKKAQSPGQRWPQWAHRGHTPHPETCCAKKGGSLGQRPPPGAQMNRLTPASARQDRSRCVTGALPPSLPSRESGGVWGLQHRPLGLRHLHPWILTLLWSRAVGRRSRFPELAT